MAHKTDHLLPHTEQRHSHSYHYDEYPPVQNDVNTTSKPKGHMTYAAVTDSDQSDPAKQNGGLNTSKKMSPEVDVFGEDDDSTKTSKGFCEDEDSTKTSKGFWDLPRQTKYLVMLCTAANFISCLSYAVPVSFYTKEAQRKGVHDVMIGFVFSVYEVVVFVSSPLFGWRMSSLGPRFLLFSGLFVSGTSSLIFGLLGGCPDEYFEVFSVLTRSMVALGYSAFLTAGTVVILGEMKGLEATAFSFVGGSAGAGFMVGPAVGGLLFEVGGFGLPFYVIGGVVLVCGLLFYYALPEIKEPIEMKSPSPLQYLRHPMAVISLLGIVTTSTGFGFLDPTLAGHVGKFGLSVGVIGFFFLLNSVAYSFTTPVWGCLSDSQNIGQGPILVGGFTLCGMGILLIGPSSCLPFIPVSIPVVLLGLAVMGFATGNGMVTTFKCLTIAATEAGLEDNINTLGLISGLFNASYSLGAGIGPILGSWLVSSLGFTSAITVIGCFDFAMAILCFIYFSIRVLNKRQRDETFQKLKTESKQNKDPSYGTITTQANKGSDLDLAYTKPSPQVKDTNGTAQ